MADIKWIKICTDIFDNKKIKQIEVLPEGDTIIVIWFKLIVLAGSINDNGQVYFTPEIPFTDQMLATQFGRPLNVVQMALNVFEKFEMIEVIDDIILLPSWEKYQNVEGMEKVREQTRKRVAKYREKQKLLPSVDDVTLHNVTVTEQNKNKSKNKKENNKHKYGEFDNILLTDDELDKLKEKFPKDYKERIEKISMYVASTGKAYKSHYATLLNWAKKDEASKPQEVKPKKYKEFEPVKEVAKTGMPEEMRNKLGGMFNYE